VSSFPFRRLRDATLKIITMLHYSVFLLSAHQTVLTFMHWVIKDEYINYFRSEKPPNVLPFLNLRSSSTFDLEKVPERLEAVYGLMSLRTFLDSENITV
jgi:hypothetical protein